MCYNLTNQVRSIAEVTTAVAKGDLRKRVEIEAEGELATLKVSVSLAPSVRFSEDGFRRTLSTRWCLNSVPLLQR